MNTKQILYNALSAQLEVKKVEADKYTNEIYNPTLDSLKNTILEYFTKNASGFHAFQFDGTNIRLEMETSWYDKIDIKLVSPWRKDIIDEVQIEWNSGSISNKNNTKVNYLNVLNKVYDNFKEITNKFINEWYPVYINNENKREEAWKEYNELKSALDNLQNEIVQDAILSMKQIGFEIKSFKPKYSLDWDYIDNERKYNITKYEQKIKLQYGRSQYDVVYVSGFKVISKKGNKYKVEVYNDSSSNGRTFDVLEKKFESFIEDVNEWENKKADIEQVKTEERYANYNK